MPGLMLALIVIPALALWRRWAGLYALARCCSALYFTYLSWLALSARPVSTAVIYIAVALGAILLALTALYDSYGEA